MRRRPPLLLAAALIALLFGPVLIKQLTPAERRPFEFVSLAETQAVEVDFENAAQKLRLAGLLFVPEGEGPFPAVAIIHGSGTSQRDNGWYLTLTRYLQERGIVVLLPDKRGSEASEGDWRTATFEDLATDTLAAVDYLAAQDRVAVSATGIVGMSQGGWIAPIAASRSADVGFVVNMVGAGVGPVEQLRYEENHNLMQMGFLPGVSNMLAVLSSAWIRHVGQRRFWDGIADFDPMAYWKDVGVETLVLLGADDTNVPSAISAARFDELGKRNIRVRVYPGSGHALEDPAGSGNSIIRRDALDEIVGFIHAAAPR